ncbi:LysR family transcriptional regulator [Rhizobium paranaense]|uniref:HTH-type transcriptional regulator TtuA n=1 Tax=Rhizobium paranaense TaxID=1650438 RepID=A0A7W9D421_9HYPH|nr:LysR family transcriptional regulator [Rhizobium paranaense]MBB5576992.1 DNA-binding transcriptional LysR family regulator [Rhizobium paranaense]
MTDALTLDQFSVFITVVEKGSFAAAARHLNRAQSVVTYAIQKLEEQSGVMLFDRRHYRPLLTDAGRALFPRAKRIVDDVADWRIQVKGIARGVEAQLTLVLDFNVPAGLLSQVLSEFGGAFPLVELRIILKTSDSAVEVLRKGDADIGIMSEYKPNLDDLERRVCGHVELVAVTAPSHPLATIASHFPAVVLRDHTQLVLGEAEQIGDQDYGIHAINRWRMTHMETKHNLLRAGIGWGSMPRVRVANDLESGALVALTPDRWEGSDRMPNFPLIVAHLKRNAIGPAASWLIEKFVERGLASTEGRHEDPVTSL